MTQLLYRLDDNVTSDYEEYLSKKKHCKVAYSFYLECNKPVQRLDDIGHLPVKYEDLVGTISIPFFEKTNG